MGPRDRLPHPRGYVKPKFTVKPESKMPIRSGYIPGLRRSYLEDTHSGGKIWGWLCCLIFAILLVSVIALVVLGAKEALADLPYFYSPQDSRLIQLDTTLCRGMSLTDKSSLINSTLYAVSSPPQLQGRNSFTLSKNSTLAEAGAFLHWHYYLHCNSNVTVQACVDPAADRRAPSSDVSIQLQLNVIKGRRHFNRWVRTKDLYYVQTSYSVVEQCTAGWTVRADNIQQAGDWYFVLYNPTSGSVAYRIFLQFQRFEYVPTVGTVIHSCVAGGEHSTTCTIPTSPGASYLVETGQPQPPNYELEVDVDVRCVLNEGLLAAVIVVPALVALLLAVVAIMLVWYCCCPKHFSVTCHKCSSGQGCAKQHRYEEI